MTVLVVVEGSDALLGREDHYREYHMARGVSQ
jgi:hypothetical protein